MGMMMEMMLVLVFLSSVLFTETGLVLLRLTGGAVAMAMLVPGTVMMNFLLPHRDLDFALVMTMSFFRRGALCWVSMY